MNEEQSVQKPRKSILRDAGSPRPYLKRKLSWGEVHVTEFVRRHGEFRSPVSSNESINSTNQLEPFFEKKHLGTFKVDVLEDKKMEIELQEKNTLDESLTPIQQMPDLRLSDIFGSKQSTGAILSLESEGDLTPTNSKKKRSIENLPFVKSPTFSDENSILSEEQLAKSNQIREAFAFQSEPNPHLFQQPKSGEDSPRFNINQESRKGRITNYFPLKGLIDSSYENSDAINPNPFLQNQPGRKKGRITDQIFLNLSESLNKLSSTNSSQETTKPQNKNNSDVASDIFFDKNHPLNQSEKAGFFGKENVSPDFTQPIPQKEEWVRKGRKISQSPLLFNSEMSPNLQGLLPKEAMTNKRVQNDRLPAKHLFNTMKNNSKRITELLSFNQIADDSVDSENNKIVESPPRQRKPKAILKNKLNPQKEEELKLLESSDSKSKENDSEFTSFGKFKNIQSPSDKRKVKKTDEETKGRVKLKRNLHPEVIENGRKDLPLVFGERFGEGELTAPKTSLKRQLIFGNALTPIPKKSSLFSLGIENPFDIMPSPSLSDNVKMTYPEDELISVTRPPNIHQLQRDLQKEKSKFPTFRPPLKQEKKLIEPKHGAEMTGDLVKADERCWEEEEEEETKWKREEKRGESLTPTQMLFRDLNKKERKKSIHQAHLQTLLNKHAQINNARLHSKLQHLKSLSLQLIQIKPHLANAIHRYTLANKNRQYYQNQIHLSTPPQKEILKQTIRNNKDVMTFIIKYDFFNQNLGFQIPRNKSFLHLPWIDFFIPSAYNAKIQFKLASPPSSKVSNEHVFTKSYKICKIKTSVERKNIANDSYFPATYKEKVNLVLKIFKGINAIILEETKEKNIMDTLYINRILFRFLFHFFKMRRLFQTLSHISKLANLYDVKIDEKNEALNYKVDVRSQNNLLKGGYEAKIRFEDLEVIFTIIPFPIHEIGPQNHPAFSEMNNFNEEFKTKIYEGLLHKAELDHHQKFIELTSQFLTKLEKNYT